MATFEEQRKTLTTVQRKFVKEYAVDFNGTEAILRARGTLNPTKSQRKAASVAASKYMTMPKIKEAVEEYIKEALGPHEKHLKENVDFWIMVRDGTVPGENKGLSIQLKAVKETLEANGYKKGDQLFDELVNLPNYKVSLTRTSDRLKASEALAKYQQMFVERKEVAVEGAVQIIDDIGGK